MCVFNDTLPSRSKSSEIMRPKNIMTWLKPNKEGEYYRFRILNFFNPMKSTRDFPFIERYVHEHWGVNDKGTKCVDDTVVCLSTKYVNYHGNSSNDCPICREAKANLNILNQCRWTDKISRDRYVSSKKKYQALIPVFIVNDPNYEQNNGRFKVFAFNNRDDYKSFLDLISMEQSKINNLKMSGEQGYSLWNSKNAVDLVLRVDLCPPKPKSANPTATPKTDYKIPTITRMEFTKKPYTIDEINKEAIEAFPFDETFYTTNTVEELEMYHKKYYARSGLNIPDEDIDFDDINDSVSKVATNMVSNPTASVQKVTKEEATKIDDLVNDPDDLDEIAIDTPQPMQTTLADEDDELLGIDDILAEM